MKPIVRCLLTALVVLVGAGVARADDVEKARTLYQQGAQHYDLAEYTQALDLFREAYRNHEEPAILYNIAQCYRQLGDSENAIRFYRAFINKGSVDDETRERLRDIVKRLEAEIEAKKAATSAPPTGLSAPATAATTVTGAAARAPTPWYRNPLGWSLSFGGLACVAIGGAGAGLGVSERNAALASTSQASFDSHHGNSIRDQQWGWPLLGMGGALAVAGVAVIAMKAVRR
jgi:tetratricopeptide (TPR) repeat protein